MEFIIVGLCALLGLAYLRVTREAAAQDDADIANGNLAAAGCRGTFVVLLGLGCMLFVLWVGTQIIPVVP